MYQRTLIRGASINLREIKEGSSQRDNKLEDIDGSLTNIHTKWRYQMILEKLYLWLFSEEERQPIGFIPLFFMIIVISSIVCLFILSVSRAIMWI